jgi:hypothetical protein
MKFALNKEGAIIGMSIVFNVGSKTTVHKVCKPINFISNYCSRFTAAAASVKFLSNAKALL